MIIVTDREHPVELMPEGAAGKIIIVEDLNNTSEYKEVLISAIKERL